jgi:hypothetical protein
MEAKFREVAGFEKTTMALARQCVRLGALLHDVGHASFSHAAEKVVAEGVGHEALSSLVVREEDLLGGPLTKLFGPECSDQVAQVIGKTIPIQLRVLSDLVSGEMDADRTDYLIRDSYHCGVDYGRFDYRRMLLCLELSEDPSGALEVALHRDGIHTFEALILARYQMNTQVYYHRLRRIYDLYLVKYHEALGDDLPNTPEKVLSQNDITMTAMILSDAEGADGERQKWAKRVADRTHHRTVHDTGVSADADGIRRSQHLLGLLQAQYAGVEFLSDIAEGSIHKLFKRGDAKDTGLVRLALIDGNRRLPNGHGKPGITVHPARVSMRARLW